MTRKTEHPILFSGAMVKAVLAGRKTQTRRVMLPPPSAFDPAPPPGAKRASAYFDSYCSRDKTPANPRGMSDRWCWWTADDRVGPGWKKCPYGVPGDQLWVREALVRTQDYDGCAPLALYASDRAQARRLGGAAKWGWEKNTLPSIFMPRWASRIQLEVVDIRAERLQAITEADARAEGATPNWVGPLDDWDADEHGFLLPGDDQIEDAQDEGYHYTAREWFAAVWDSINARRGRSWGVNPWVWVVDFRRAA